MRRSHAGIKSSPLYEAAKFIFRTTTGTTPGQASSAILVPPALNATFRRSAYLGPSEAARVAGRTGDVALAATYEREDNPRCGTTEEARLDSARRRVLPSRLLPYAAAVPGRFSQTPGEQPLGAYFRIKDGIEASPIDGQVVRPACQIGRAHV